MTVITGPIAHQDSCDFFRRHGRARSGPPLDPPGSPLNLTVLKRRPEWFICQQGWPQQSRLEAFERGSLSSRMDEALKHLRP
jgi:hypothetical protein